MCIDTASAPSFRASSTVATRTFEFELTPMSVDAERCRISPTSCPVVLCPWGTSPLCISTAVAPPSTTSPTVLFMSISPGIGPTLIPWSIGTITAFPLCLSMILSILMFLPNTSFTVLRVNTAHYNSVSTAERNGNLSRRIRIIG